MEELIFTSKEAKKLLAISDCQLMHLRTTGKLEFFKKKNAYYYALTSEQLVRGNNLYRELISWYKDKHVLDINNTPHKKSSVLSLVSLTKNILNPIEKEFGKIEITYGFVSAALNRYIQKNNPSGTSPSLDQHGCSESNLSNNPICGRGGAACDFIISDRAVKMDNVMNFIVTNLEFDKLYFYGPNKPLHISIGEQNSKHLQIMNTSIKGKRIPGKRAFGEESKKLAAEYSK